MPANIRIEGTLKLGPYKDYFGIAKYDEEADVFHGEIAGLRDVITFQGKTTRELEKSFRDSISDYLAFCRERGELPEKPYSGKFVTRITPEVHKKLAMMAQLRGKSLNSFVGFILRQVAEGKSADAGNRRQNGKSGTRATATGKISGGAAGKDRSTKAKTRVVE